MSILLDAVTRSKQQEQGIELVITPRAQYQQMNSGLPVGVKFGLVIGLLLLLVLVAWLLSPMGPFKQQVSTEGEQPVVQVVDASFERKPQASVELSEPSIQLAGKVALPLAVERPIAPSRQLSQPSRTQVNLAQGSNTIAVATRVESEQVEAEPIILGANSNQRGQELLSALQAQVNEAANEVGLEQNVKPKVSDYSSSEPSDNLVAAFQAALAEVEKQNAIARPVSKPELDPIPQVKADVLPSYGQLPAGIQLQVPEFNILAHVYSSKADNRWLNVDGKELQEGDSIGGKMKIIEIRPRDVVLEISGTQFKVPAI